MGLSQQACENFTHCLQIGKVFDPQIRQKSLEQIFKIFKKNKLLKKCPQIAKLLQRSFNKKNNDIVFCLDFSESMGQSSRKAYALKSIHQAFNEYMKAEDRVAFVVFNKNSQVKFPLILKGKSEAYINKMIQQQNEEIPFGETALYQAIHQSIKLFKKAEKLNNSKYIIALTDGEDNQSQIQPSKIYQLLKKNNIHLMIIGLALNKELISCLKEMCRATEEGVFVESADSNDIQIAFQAITDMIYGPSDIIVEQLN